MSDIHADISDTGAAAQGGQGTVEDYWTLLKPRVMSLVIFTALAGLIAASGDIHPWLALVAPEQLGEGETPLLQVVQAGAPNFPLWIFGFITMFAVANSALINMLMASRLVYGMSREHVLPPALGKVHTSRRTPYIAIGFTTLLAFALITFVGEVPALGGTTALLLLCVFTVVNVCVLVLRRDPVGHSHFHSPTILPILGAVCCAFLAGPWTGRDPVQYKIAGVLIGIGIALWVITMLVNRAVGQKPAEPTMETTGGPGPVN